jgi:hypothetical protein
MVVVAIQVITNARHASFSLVAVSCFRPIRTDKKAFIRSNQYYFRLTVTRVEVPQENCEIH